MKHNLHRIGCVILVILLTLPGKPGALAGDALQPTSVSSLSDENWDDRFALNANGLTCLYQCGINAIAPDGAGNVYIAGYFYKPDNYAINAVARWDGAAWHAMGPGNFDNTAILASLVVTGSDVYVGGYFSVAGGVPADSIAHWDGAAWQAMGTGIKTDITSGEMVKTIAVSGSDVYAGGRFISAGGITVTNIARWDGLAWHALGAPGSGPVVCDTLCAVKKIVASGSDIFAYGTFKGPGGNAINTVARWDGSAWHVMARDFSAETVSGLAVANGNIYLAGNFSLTENFSPLCADPLQSSSLAVWNGSDWSYPTCKTNGQSNVVAVDGADIYIAEPGVYPDYSIERWDGNAWLSLGSGVDNFVDSIAIADRQVYVGGGLITTAGGKPSHMFAIWHMPTAPFLAVSYQNGAPGSTFSFSAENFPPHTPVTITVNGYAFPAQMSDANGRLTVTLHTAAGAQTGLYLITFSVAAVQDESVAAPSVVIQASTIFDLSSSAPTRTAGGPTPLELPDSVKPANGVYLPILAK